MREYQHALHSALSGTTNKDAVKLYQLVSETAMERVRPQWKREDGAKRACYFSAEFLLGRMVYANLYNLGLLEDMRAAFGAQNLDPNLFEEIEDLALGNGGLGRLAACFLDSAATHNLPVDGYGIRYRYGLFRQYFQDGFQREEPDDWLRFGDPWSERVEEDKIKISFGDQTVWAVPYDMPVIGYGGGAVNTLRLWQAEAVQPIDFPSFNDQKYDVAYKAQNEASAISDVLYPNDDTPAGKRLRLKQQYFFASASLQSILRQHRAKGGKWEDLGNRYAIQLNDTHPTVAIPELLRILVGEEGLDFDAAFAIAQSVFAYTNHTIMAEALEKWDVPLFCSVLPEVYPYVVMLQNHLRAALAAREIAPDQRPQYDIVDGGRVHMARMAIYAGHSVNGVAALHTEILKNDALKEWYALYPDRFNNKTNGITQRRWLGLCNPELADFITRRIGDGWLTDLYQLKALEKYANDGHSLRELMDIRSRKKRQLADHVRVHEYGYELNCDSIFDLQIKRLHEYKRQLLNAFSILHIYFALKDGSLQDFHPMTFLFGAKAAPGYYRAKGIIKFINEIAARVNNDPDTKEKLQVLFVQNYNVSYAEKLIPAADLSEQISTAGTEASGTGNMKMMLNGAPTLGTYDGANIEIVEASGAENNFIFGARVEQIEAARPGYNPHGLYESDPSIRRVLDALIDGTFSDGGTGMFRELYNSLLFGASWHKADPYFLLLDFDDYVQAKLAANRAYANRDDYAKKCLLNIANAGKFSSDRTISAYAREIWGLG